MGLDQEEPEPPRWRAGPGSIGAAGSEKPNLVAKARTINGPASATEDFEIDCMRPFRAVRAERESSATTTIEDDAPAGDASTLRNPGHPPPGL